MKKLLFFASAVAMLASCSKDFTEEVGFSTPEGKVKIVARLSVENETATRTHLDENLKYSWDAGDAVGVFVATDNDASNAYFGYTGTGDDFTGDFLPALPEGVEGYYGYYPWDRGATLDGQELTMYINAKQKYNRNAASFAATEAPAAAYAKTLNEAKAPEFKFMGLTAFVRVRIYGIGEVKSLKLKTTIDSKTDTKLNGEFTVDLSNLVEGEEIEYTVNGSNEIVLDLGSETVSLDLNSKNYKEFWFVVPAGITFNTGDKLDFYVNDFDNIWYSYTFDFSKNEKYDSYTTKCNTILTLGTPYEYVADNATLISEPKDLLWYLYFVNHGKEAFNAYGGDHEAFFNITKNEDQQSETTKYTLKPAILTKDIDLKDVLTRLWEDQYQQLSAADKALYDWYVHPVEGGADAEYYINSIGETSTIDEKKLSYEAEAVEEWKITGYGEGVTISGLTIKGNGVFATEGASNITLKNVTVDASEVEEGEKIHFLYETLLNGVTIGADCQLVGAEGALIDEVKVSDKVEIPEGLVFPTDEKNKEIAFAYTLDINENITWADYKDYNFVEKKISKPGVVVKVADADEANEFFDTEIEITPEATYYSVVDANTSYWTGTVATTSGTEITYAEELAHVKISQSTRGAKYTLANNIDLMNKSWMGTRAKGTFTLNGNDKTISNVKIYEVNPDQKEGGQAYALFGPKANISNLTIDGVEIVVPANAKLRATDNYLAVATLAGEGSASKVTVKGLKIDVSASTVTPTYVGGLFAVYNGGDVTECSVALAADAPAGYGDLAGLYTITPTTANDPEIAFAATVAGAKKFVGKVLVTSDLAESIYTTLSFDDKVYTDANRLPSLDTDIEYNHQVEAATGGIIDKFTLKYGETKTSAYFEPNETK